MPATIPKHTCCLPCLSKTFPNMPTFSPCLLPACTAALPACLESENCLPALPPFYLLLFPTLSHLLLCLMYGWVDRRVVLYIPPAEKGQKNLSFLCLLCVFLCPHVSLYITNSLLPSMPLYHIHANMSLHNMHILVYTNILYAAHIYAHALPFNHIYNKNNSFLRTEQGALHGGQDEHLRRHALQHFALYRARMRMAHARACLPVHLQGPLPCSLVFLHCLPHILHTLQPLLPLAFKHFTHA